MRTHRLKDEEQRETRNKCILPKLETQIEKQTPQSRFYAEWHIKVQKFMYFYQKLRYQQYLESQSSIPKYPFVLEKNGREIYVHLGGHQVDLFNSPSLYLPLIQEQPQISFYEPRSITPIDKPIFKKKTYQLEQKDTKNIPKNYCKAIITFAQKNQHLVQQILQDQKKTIKFLDLMQSNKKKLLNIKVFSHMLKQSDNPETDEMNKVFRILSRLFIRKHAVNYIFNSKIVQQNWHLKYRYKIYKGVQNPDNFSHIKNL